MGRLCSEVISKIHEVTCKELARLKNSLPGPRMLDVGCWDGEATIRYGKVLGSEDIFGVDIFDSAITQAQAKGIKAFKVDLEKDDLPFENNFFDLVICNQVFEHLKQIYRPISEIHRALKPEGIFIFSVPNLASLHNRILLALGEQPTSIRIFGPHVRGFTYKAIKRFLTYNDLFKIIRVIGIGFYPFPMKFGGSLFGRMLVSMSHTCLFVLKKERQGKVNWQQRVINMQFQTDYV